MAIRRLDWDQFIGKRVAIYRNLHNGLISVKAKVGDSYPVVGHIDQCILSDVTFSVGEESRKRVIRERKKNVHAYARGILIAQVEDTIDAPIDLAYDPYNNETFVERYTSRSIYQCSYLAVRDNLVYVSQDALIDGPQLRLISKRSTRRAEQQLSILGGFDLLALAA